MKNNWRDDLVNDAESPKRAVGILFNRIKEGIDPETENKIFDLKEAFAVGITYLQLTYGKEESLSRGLTEFDLTLLKKAGNDPLDASRLEQQLYDLKCLEDYYEGQEDFSEYATSVPLANETDEPRHTPRNLVKQEESLQYTPVKLLKGYIDDYMKRLL